MSVSIMTFPTRWMRVAGTPSRARFSSASRDGVNSHSATRSVNSRFSSSGMVRS